MRIVKDQAVRTIRVLFDESDGEVLNDDQAMKAAAAEFIREKLAQEPGDDRWMPVVGYIDGWNSVVVEAER